MDFQVSMTSAGWYFSRKAWTTSLSLSDSSSEVMSIWDESFSCTATTFAMAALVDSRMRAQMMNWLAPSKRRTSAMWKGRCNTALRGVRG